MAASIQVVFDCAEPDRLAHFWAAALGYIIQPPPPGFDTWEELLAEIGVPEPLWGDRSGIIDPEGRGPRLFFQRVPEGKSAKNRVHLDVSVAGPEVQGPDRLQLLEAAAERLIGQGASRVAFFDEYGEQWLTMRDPEGNEFDLQ